MTKTGLVLGAGGATAWVFHTAVLRTLRDETGVDPLDADLIVGTSAGASLAAALRAGIDLEDFYRMATRPPTDDQRRAMLAELKAARKSLVPLSAGMVRHMFPGGDGATLALAGILPPGLFPTGWLAELPGMGSFDGWPEGLWVPAVRVPDGEVVVFGRDRRDVPVPVAVEASSAVPGMFRPCQIGDETFVDGGVTSSTHADLLLSEGVERAIVSAPMSRPSGGLFSRNARRQLAAELESLRAGGVEVLAVQPSSEISNLARGYPRRRPEAAIDIAGHAEAVTRLAVLAS